MGKYISLGEILKVIKAQFIVSVIAMFFGMLFIGFSATGFSKYIFSIVFILFNILSLYNASYEIAIHNNKEYNDEKSFVFKGLFLGLGIVAVSVILYILYYFTWKCDIVTYSSGFINNLIFIAWNYPFNNFLNPNNGIVSVAGVAVEVIVISGTCFFGYFAGIKKFDLSQKVTKIVYDNKDNEENE